MDTNENTIIIDKDRQWNETEILQIRINLKLTGSFVIVKVVKYLAIALQN